MKTCKPLLLAMLLLLLISIRWLSINQGKETVYQTKIKALQAQNEVLIKRNDSLDVGIEKLEYKSDSLKELVTQKRTSIQLLKTQRDEKIKAIATYSNDRLYRFFAGLSTTSSGRQ